MMFGHPVLDNGSAVVRISGSVSRYRVGRESKALPAKISFLVSGRHSRSKALQQLTSCFLS